jgi:hypothetical protein
MWSTTAAAMASHIAVKAALSVAPDAGLASNCERINVDRALAFRGINPPALSLNRS